MTNELKQEIYVEIQHRKLLYGKEKVSVCTEPRNTILQGQLRIIATANESSI